MEQQPQKAPEKQNDELSFGNVPNYLTLARMLFVPVVVAMLFQKDPFWDYMAGWTFALASITDFFDGYLARTRKQITVYGKLMDPLADKFLVVSSLVMLQEMGRIHPLVVILLICRELAITGLRALASAEGVIISASGGGRLKTATQMVAIPFLMAKQGVFGLPFTYPLGNILLYVSLSMSLWSAKDYIVDFFRALKDGRRVKAAERRAQREARAASRVARAEARRKKAESSAT